MTDMSPSQFAVVRDYGDTCSIVQLSRVTKQLVFWEPWGAGRGFRQVYRDSVLAAFDVRDDADRLCQSINGVRGERDRRIRAAHDAYVDQVAKLVKSALAKAASDDR